MAAVLFPIFTICHLVLLGWTFLLYQQSHQLGLVVLMIIIVAITYDNFIVSIGRWIGEGEILLLLSQPRFFGHVLLTPLSVIAAFSFCYQSGLGWASQPVIVVGVWLATLVLITAEVLTYYKEFKPKAVWDHAILRYTNSAYKCLPVASIITTIIVGIIGGLIWQQLGFPWLFVSSLVMFIGGAIPQKVSGAILCSGVEVILIAGFCTTANQIQAQISMENYLL
ncbi:hypothetical protein Syn7502_00744 [Synechococcus sp. PCC 7502]|uniref:hypothetical protein n=1 Tax=Synechococcus sp. PCC 7502 TaxID=1173263 RepID=UPI00029FA992|nr:hypothetical protein [Synechococcus sp. PCC 7502]AFY72878.1 hypothetical protein Syn7502_00744 [Synechococcus sp. PCC 7502]